MVLEETADSEETVASEVGSEETEEDKHQLEDSEVAEVAQEVDSEALEEVQEADSEVEEEAKEVVEASEAATKVVTRILITKNNITRAITNITTNNTKSTTIC